MKTPPLDRLKSLAHQLYRLVCPWTCVYCEKLSDQNRDLCFECQSQLPWLNVRCHCCALPLSANVNAILCGECQDKIPPFQSGFGQTLLASYWKQEQYPKEFYENRFLWDITSQGYKEVNNTGFGYYRDFSALKLAISQNKISAQSVIAFSYSSRDKRLQDISEEVKQRLFK